VRRGEGRIGREGEGRPWERGREGTRRGGVEMGGEGVRSPPSYSLAPITIFSGDSAVLTLSRI